MSHHSRCRPTHAEIAVTAYYIWEDFGKPTGKDLAIWLEAEWVEGWRHFSHKPIYAVERDSR
jgi:hypothetical protein